MKILLDTNFIITSIKQKVGLFSQLEDLFPSPEIIIPDKVIGELERIKIRKDVKGRDKEIAELALKILDKEKFTKITADGKVDDFIVNYALANRELVIASLDREIRAKLKGKVRLLTLRDKKRVVVA